MDYRLRGDPSEMPIWYVPYERAMYKEDAEVDEDDPMRKATTKELMQ